MRASCPSAHRVSASTMRSGSTRLEDAKPFGKGLRRIDESPDQVPGDHGIIGCVRFQGLFRIAEDETDLCLTLICLGAGAGQHGFGEVEPGDLEAEIVEQMRDDAGAAGKVQDGPARTRHQDAAGTARASPLAPRR